MLQDLRYALRMLARAPGFTAVALLTLALGIGVNTAIFSLVSPMLFQPLPFPQSRQMIQIQHLYKGQIQNGLYGSEAIYLLQHQRSLSAAAIADIQSNANLTGAGPALKVSDRRVSHGFFDVYAVPPRLGRGFTAADDVPGAPPVAILSDGLWRSQFGADPQVLGRSIHLNDAIYAVVGVMPPGFNDLIADFAGFTPTGLWTAMQPTEAKLAPLGPNLEVIARLKPGVGMAQAQSDLALVKAAFNHIHPQVAPKMSWGVQSFHDAVVGDTSQPLLLLLGAVGLVLLIACANLANLLLSRSTARTREMAIRAALGADPGRIFRQLLTESLVLAGLGGALGLLLAWWTVPVLARLTPSQFALPITGHLSGPALLYTLALAVVTGILFGLAPAWQASRPALQANLKDSAAGASSSRAGRARGALIVAEVALSFLLLAGAGLLAASLLQLSRVNPGFDAAGILTAQTSITGARLQSTAATSRYADAVLDRLRALPGVSAAATITGLPLTRAMNYPVQVVGHKGEDYSDDDTEWRAVSPGFFQTLHIPLLLGRDFTASDSGAGAKVAIVSEAFARHNWAHQSPLGNGITMPLPDSGAMVVQVIGVAADIRENGVDTAPPLTLYVPQAQVPDALNALVNHWFPLGFVIRSQGASVASMHQAFSDADPNQPVFNLASLDSLRGASLSQYNFMATLLAIFAGLALALAAIGIYGVLSYAVARQTRDIGIRASLGASRSDLIRQYVGQGLRWTGLGLILGLLGAVAFTRLLAGFLFGVGATNPYVLALGALALLVLAALAALQPAWRATRVDPLQALREG